MGEAKIPVIESGGCLRGGLGDQCDCKEGKVFVGKGLFCTEIVVVVKKKIIHFSKLTEFPLKLGTLTVCKSCFNKTD